LDKPSCGCREYVDTGLLPCIHMAAAYVHPRKPGPYDLPEDLAEYADPHYRMETLAKVYKDEEVIIPCTAGRDLLPDGITLPQANVPQAGRPKKKRRRGGSDKRLDQKKKTVSRCSRCGKVGHNSRSCKEELDLEQVGLVDAKWKTTTRTARVTTTKGPPAAPRAEGQRIDKRQSQKRSFFLWAREILLARRDQKGGEQEKLTTLATSNQE
jgi:hypothetical protein